MKEAFVQKGIVAAVAAATLVSCSTENRNKHEDLVPPPGAISSLIQTERGEWKKFLGYQIEIPAPSQDIMQILDKAKDERLSIFEPHYLPPITFTKDASYPGWKEKPSDDFWKAIDEKEIAKDAASLSGEWILIDKSTLNTHGNDKCSTVYGTDDPTFSCPKDPLKKFGSEDYPYSDPYALNSGSFARYAELELVQDTAENIANKLNIQVANVRFPRAIEWNVLSNVFYRDWIKKEHSEYFADGEPNADDYFYGGSTKKGVQQFHHNIDDEWKHEPRALRPVVVFSQ